MCVRAIRLIGDVTSPRGCFTAPPPPRLVYKSTCKYFTYALISAKFVSIHIYAYVCDMDMCVRACVCNMRAGGCAFAYVRARIFDHIPCA